MAKHLQDNPAPAPESLGLDRLPAAIRAFTSTAIKAAGRMISGSELKVEYEQPAKNKPVLMQIMMYSKTKTAWDKKIVLTIQRNARIPDTFLLPSQATVTEQVTRQLSKIKNLKI